MPLKIDDRAWAALEAPPATTKVDGLSRGAALAILLRGEGLALRPEKPTGEPLRLTIVPQHGADRDAWPVGYDPEGSTSETAPVLMQSIPVEIDGFSLADAVGAIEARLGGVPIVFDAFALRSRGIDPATTQVSIKRTKTFYKRILDRLAFQARLQAKLRVDEAGTPFVWLSR